MELVDLVTINLETGEEKRTKGYEREMLVKWIEHQRSECAEGILDWKVEEVG